MEDRPYSVSETAYGMAEIDAPADASDQRRRIFFAHVTAQRTTHWERGNDPMTSFAFSRYRRRDGDPLDPFGRPIAQINVACPRGWRSMADRPGAAYLSTFTVTAYAAPAGSLAYIHTRAASVTMFEINGTAGKTVADLATLDDTGPGLKVIGHSRHFYDGPAFLGLPLGQLGDHGLLARTESLALADDLIQAAYGAQTPPYLVASGSPAWTADYPTEFRTALATRAGYSFHAGSASPLDPGGYYVTSERRRYDVHSDPNGRGLLLEALGALHDAAVDPTAHRVLYTYDRFALLPVRATDAAGLAIAATYDYRVLRPLEVIDANGNATRFKYSPQGLLTASWVRGKTATDGDQLRPSLEFEYALLAFDQSPPQHRQPIFARTIRRVHHDSKLTVPLPERDATITTVEYTDGFGRLLQLRRQDDDDRFGDSGFGGGSTLLPPDQDDDASAIVVGQTNASAAAPDVVVNGWTIYDNKGQVVEQYEPFFSEGWAYGQPADAQLGQKVRMFYDPRGHIVRTVMPDGAEELVVQGVPGRIAVPDLERPDAYEPTPWKLYSYDANDNAGRTHQAESATWRHHWNTPSSVVLDALGRTVETIQRNRNAPAVPGGPRPPMEELRTRTTHDIRGNVLAVTDARNRIAIRNVFDLANRAMRTASIDAGERSIVLDAGNNAVETRSGTGALVLSASDRIDRTIRIWARDGAGQPTTLRERHEYGDGGQANQPAAERNAARANNQLGRLARVCDEAGQLLFAAYDFKGNLLEKTRRPIADAAVLAAFDGSPPGWNVTAHRVDWQNIAAVPLGPVSYTSNLGYDALNRATRVTYPEDVDHSRRSSLPVYGRSGALRSVTLAADRHVERIARNAKGQRVLVVYGNGVMTRYAHDPRTMRLLRLRTERFTTTSNLSYRPAGEVLQDVAYDYDLAGNLLAMHDRTPGSGISGPPAGEDALDRIFGYDALYRLNSATGRECDTPPDLPWDSAPRCVDRTKVRAWTEQYTFDSTGSLTRLRHAMGADARISEFTVAGSSNQLASLTQGSRVYAYAYDANGNLTQETTSRHLEWDHRDRLRVYRTQIPGSEPTVHAHYQYDWMGQRVRKIVRKGANRVETTTYIDGVFEHERIVTAGTVQENSTVHVMDDRARIAMARVGTAFAGDVLPALQYHLGDHLGSSAVVLDATGALINREEYLPFGTTSFGSYARKRYRFGGHERDGESDLGYAGARYYLPWAGRWASCDPAGPMDGLNLYAYVRNSPLVLNDPTGTEGENDYGGTSPPGGAATPDTTSQERPADHEASTPQPNEEPFGPPPPPPKAPTQEQLFAAQQRAAYEKSVAERNSWGQTGKSLMRSVIPATMTATSPAPRLQGMPPGMSQYSDPAAQGDISAAGGNVAKKTVEYGGTAATVVGDVGMAGAQVGFKTIGSIAAEEAVTTAPNLVARAAEIHSAIAPHMSLWAAERTTVAVTRAMIDGVSKTIVTVNNRKGYQLLQQGIGQVAQHELGQAPSRLNTWFRQIWNFKNLHAEELGIRTLKRMGATGGETATAPWRGCFRCQMMIDRLNGMFGESWKHLNPAADVVLRPFR